MSSIGRTQREFISRWSWNFHGWTQCNHPSAWQMFLLILVIFSFLSSGFIEILHLADNWTNFLKPTPSRCSWILTVAPPLFFQWIQWLIIWPADEIWWELFKTDALEFRADTTQGFLVVDEDLILKKTKSKMFQCHLTQTSATVKDRDGVIFFFFFFLGSCFLSRRPVTLDPGGA